ncbi:MAG: transposase [Candidatus Moranbacteria bacterium]|nr:transposase [Candidatus Moranbacteria bacterium]
MAGSRKIYTPQFKFQRALEAIKNNNLSGTSRQYDINANVLLRWKNQLMEKGGSIFADTPEKETKELKRKIAKLEQMLGKKEVELNLLKNFSDFYESKNSP